MKDFKSLIVWDKAHQLVLEIYKIGFPKEELYGLNSQIRRASSAIPTNIAEGCGRGSDKDFKRFLQIAFGSASEVEYLLILSKDLEYIEHEHFVLLYDKLEEIKKMLAALIVKLRG